jgi:hypothetical protein
MFIYYIKLLRIRLLYYHVSNASIEITKATNKCNLNFALL